MADSKLDIILTAKDMSGAAFAGVQGRIGAMTSSVAKLSGAFGLLAGGAALSGIVMGFDRLTDAASDFDETFSKVKTLFGPETTKLISDWGDNAALSIGLSKQAALDAVGTMGNMFLQLGANTGEAANLSKRMVELSADLASFHNVAGGSVEVSLAMQSAFRGEYDALQRYIPTINAAAVQQRALADSGKSTATELTALEKAMAVHAITIESAGAATGDFSRTSGELANQQRILDAQLKDIQATIGKGFIPIATDAIRATNDWIAANKGLAETLTSGIGPVLKIIGMGIENTFGLDKIRLIKQFYDAVNGNLPRLSGSQVPDDIYGDFSTPTVKPKVAGLQSGEEMFNLANFQKMAADAARYEEKKVKEAIAALNADLGTEYVDMWRIKAGEVKEIQDRSWAAIGESYIEASGRMTEISKYTAEAMQDNFSDLFFDTMKWQFDDLGDYATRIADSILRIFADMAAQLTRESLFGDGAGWAGLLKGLFSSTASSGSYAGAGTYGVNPGSVQWHGTGGIITEPIVGMSRSGKLHGFGDTAEAVVPLDRLGKSSGGAISVVNHWTVTALDAQSVEQFLQRNGSAIMDTMLDKLTYSAGQRNEMRSLLE